MIIFEQLFKQTELDFLLGREKITLSLFIKEQYISDLIYMLTSSADKVGGSKKGQKYADVILEWSPKYLYI